MTPRSLSNSDLMLVEIVTRCVAMMTVQQIASLFSGQGSSNVVRRRIVKLVKAGWLELHHIVACKPVPANNPFFRWFPGGDEPDFEDISRFCRLRSAGRQMRIDVVCATSKSANLMGSSAVGMPRPEHWNHDLNLAGVYCTYRRRWPLQSRLWVGEHALPKAGYRIKDPDAFLVDHEGNVLKVIEMAGVYSELQVERFHQFCAENDLGYEIW